MNVKAIECHDEGLKDKLLITIKDIKAKREEYHDLVTLKEELMKVLNLESRASHEDIVD